MNLLPFAHLPLYTLFSAPKRLHYHWVLLVLQSSQEKLKINYAKFLGANKVYYGNAIGK